MNDLAIHVEKKLDPSRIPQAQSLQRKGLTLTEIANRMRVPRELIVDALYYDVVTK